MRRSLLLTTVLLALIGSPALATVSTAENVAVYTTRDRSITFVIRTTDEDMDPNFLLDPITFALGEKPLHGVLVEGLDHTQYALPNIASVTVTYAPTAGFVGEDTFTVWAIDADDGDEDIVRVWVRVSESGVAPPRLSGSWDGELGVDLQVAEFTTFAQELVVQYQVGGLTLKGAAEFGGVSSAPGWQGLRLNASGVVAGSYLSGEVAFDPSASPLSESFQHFLTFVSGRVGDISLTDTLYLAGSPGQSYEALTIQGALAGATAANTTRWIVTEECLLAFSRNDTQVRWQSCDAWFYATMAVTDAGFANLRLGADQVPMPWVDDILGGFTLSPSVTFTPSEKSMLLTLDWDPGTAGCIRVFGELVSGSDLGAIESLSVYGVVLECDSASGIHVRSATSLDPARNVEITGEAAYFESFELSGGFDACCSLAGTWSAVTYFRSGSSQLFDWGMTAVSADIDLSDSLTLRINLAIRSGELADPVAEFTVGWTASW